MNKNLNTKFEIICRPIYLSLSLYIYNAVCDYVCDFVCIFNNNY